MPFSFKIKEENSCKNYFEEGMWRKRKFLEKFALTVYSYIVLVLAVIMCLLVFNWIDIGTVTKTVTTNCTRRYFIKNNISNKCNIYIIINKMYILWFRYRRKNKRITRNIIKNENGQLLITKETLDNMIKSVVYKFDNIENCTPRISIDEQNEISITLQVVLKDDVIIKDLANRLQTKVKEEMKKTSDLDVKNVNIKL